MADDLLRRPARSSSENAGLVVLKWLRGVSLPADSRVLMTATLFEGTWYVVTATFASCLTLLSFTLDHKDPQSWALFGLTIAVAGFRLFLLPCFRRRLRRGPMDVAESSRWGAAYTAGAVSLAACVGGAVWRAYHTPGPQGAAEQTALFALSMGLATGAAIRWSVPPWTAIGTTMVVMPLTAYCNLMVGDGQHLLISLLSAIYFVITIGSIRTAHEEFSKSVLAAWEIERLATCDKLTGVLNRLGFARAFESLHKQSVSRHAMISMLLIDLDGFKQVNDVHGHAAGDSLLVEVARTLEQCCAGTDTIARLGGDEFAITFAGSAEEADRLAGLIVAHLRQPFGTLGKVLEIGGSIGVFTSADGSLDAMLSSADFALYKAKASGRNCHVAFVPAMRIEIDDRMAFEVALRSALSGGQISVDYQPIVHLGSRDFVGVEALARWNRPGFGPVEPDVFIPVAEELGLIGAIGEWVLETACREVSGWPAHLTLAVNVSSGQFIRTDLPTSIFRILARTGLSAHRLELEVTEQIAANNSARAEIEVLQAQGVRVSLGKFGTRSASIKNLMYIQFAKLKIDRSLVSSSATEPGAERIVHGIVRLAHGMDLPVVAEGVETAEQVTMLASLGCNQVQGIFFGAPMGGEEARRLMHSRRAISRLNTSSTDARMSRQVRTLRD